jgi:hypothetical protein
MKRTIYITILFIFLFSFTYSQEIILRNNSYSDLVVEGANNKQCEQYNFVIDSAVLSTQKFPIFSIKTSFAPIIDDESKITLNFNNQGEITIWGDQFSCDGWCWGRVVIPKAKLNSNNTLEICVTNTELTERTVVFADSYLDFYESPVFTLEKISPGTILLGDKAEMQIVAKNFRSKDANVFIQFIDPVGKKVVNIDSFDIVEGDSTARTTILAGEQKLLNII